MSKTPAPSVPLLRYMRRGLKDSNFFTAYAVESCRPKVGKGRQSIPLSTKSTDYGPRAKHTLISTVSRTSLPLPPPAVRLSALVPLQSSIFGGFGKAKPKAYESDWPDRKTQNAYNQLFKRLWRQGLRQGPLNSPPADMGRPLLPSFLDDSASGLARPKGPKAGSEMKLRCTEIDAHGNVITVNGEFKKSELIAKYGLLPRDLRKIDSSLLPHILVRPTAILINLLHLRVLIQHNRVLVLDVYGSTDSFAQSQFMYDLCGKLSQKMDTRQAGCLPYELRALEAVLISVTQGLETEFENVSEPVVQVLRDLEEDIDRDKLQHLLVWSKKLGTFEQKARLVRDALEDLLEADDDLASMYQTERIQGRQRDESNHTEVEMLLESYHKVCDEIVQISGNLVSNIRNTEEIVKAILDANRNSLMLLDLKFSIGTLGIGSGAFIASLYGMNLKNFIEESDLGFWGVTGSSFIFAVAVCWYGMKKLQRVQRLSMWGNRRSMYARNSATSNGANAASADSRKQLPHYYHPNHRHPYNQVYTGLCNSSNWRNQPYGGFANDDGLITEARSHMHQRPLPSSRSDVEKQIRAEKAAEKARKQAAKTAKQEANLAASRASRKTTSAQNIDSEGRADSDGNGRDSGGIMPTPA